MFEEDEGVGVAVLCCTADDFVCIGSCNADEPLLDVLWKKSMMVAELWLSRGLFFIF